MKYIILSDYVIDFLVKNGIKDIFLVSGGGMMYLLDAVGRNNKIRYISNHHEQASATCAESYARITSHIAACLVTTGPGGTNAITGVAGAWLDSIPMIVISGQVKTKLIADYNKNRQIGPQEMNIIDMVKPITKYAVTVTDPLNIKYELEKSFYLATTGRSGPVWINIPLNVQAEKIDQDNLKSFKPDPIKSNNYTSDSEVEIINKLNKSKRPVLICGNGIRLAKGVDILKQVLNKIEIPVLLPFGGLDLVAENEHFFVAKFGPGGQRRGNFVLQNADLIISVGASLNVASVGFDYEGFAPKAEKIIVNIDKHELHKKTLHINKSDILIEEDAKVFLTKLLYKLRTDKIKINPKWINACKNWIIKYPNIVNDFYEDKNHVNSYVFFDILSSLLDSKAILTTGIGLDASSMYQAFKTKAGQRAYVNKNLGQMGWGLPGAIGACVGNKRKQTISVVGDGDIQVNVHELGTISYNRLPIKIFVFNNGLYESIRSTQNNLFDGRIVGADQNSGISCPNFKKLADAYGISYSKIENNSQIKKTIKVVLEQKEPVLCEVKLSYFQKRIPKSSAYLDKDGVIRSKPLEDMAPFLPEQEIFENMHLFEEE